MNKPYIDFHLHTTNSDGDCSMEEVIVAANKARLSTIAITDHNVFSIQEPEYYKNLAVIPGAEFSTSYDYGDDKKIEVHILGLFWKGIDPALTTIFQKIDKRAYVEAIVKKLNSLGVEMTLEELEARPSKAKQFGRHKVADLLVEKGYSPNREAAMDYWVGNRSQYYINPVEYVSYIRMEECVQRISESKGRPGFPILAHPFYYKFSKPQIEELVSRYRNATDKPLGIEIYYGKYSTKEIEYLEYLADKYHLLPSAGSDRHRAEQPFKKGNYALFADMKKELELYWK